MKAQNIKRRNKVTNLLGIYANQKVISEVLYEFKL